MSRPENGQDDRSEDDPSAVVTSKNSVRFSRKVAKVGGSKKSLRDGRKDDQDDGAVFRSWVVPEDDGKRS
ncbi:hypothetical protein [Agrobacterium sp. FDAARGOS_525]|jgi:hypothetical protein|uniref:hypothetical protein n=1 Tax=Agrobacterium sp. FDAARGOS_525 TaxID=2420311 RepID=UPI000F66C883|nr:hypothetical protein [Agrobacterium sp. FDAARGOS_525]